MSQSFTGAWLPAWAWCHYQQLKMNHETFPKASCLTKLTIGYGELLQKNCVEWSSTRRRTVQARSQGRPPQPKRGLYLHACSTATISHNARAFYIVMSCVCVCVRVCLCVCVCMVAGCWVCSAVIWTPSCCWRASTTSAPCCCRVRGRTSPSWTPTRGMTQKTWFEIDKFYRWQLLK